MQVDVVEKVVDITNGGADYSLQCTASLQVFSLQAVDSLCDRCLWISWRRADGDGSFSI